MNVVKCRLCKEGEGSDGSGVVKWVFFFVWCLF